MTLKSQTGRQVFVTNLGAHNYAKAERFGDLVPVTQARVNLFHTDRLLEDIRSALAAMGPEDYVLTSGNPLISGLVVAEVISRFRRVNFLYWDPLYQDYIVRPWPKEAA